VSVEKTRRGTLNGSFPVEGNNETWGVDLDGGLRKPMKGGCDLARKVKKKKRKRKKRDT